MREVSGWRSDGVQERKGKKYVRSLGNMEKKREETELGEEESRRKDSARQRARARNQILFYSYGK